MLKSEFFEHANAWSLTCLENIFYYALEVKSKSLIQACIFVADQEFSGVASFSQQTQVKFLLESIRHIVSENCQEEFVHVMRYLKLLHTLCPNVGCIEEYVNSVSKINQSFILYTLLENESASTVCEIMNAFFPENNVLQSYGIKKGATKKRFLAVVKRQIYNFRKLVVKLMTNVEFRSYYFYDEWLEDYGEAYHEELKTDLNAYLKQVQACLLAGRDMKQIYESWLESDQCNSPAMLYFLKLLMDSGTEVPEREIFKLLSWLFPNTDLTPLAPECCQSLTVPIIFMDTPFLKIFLQAGWSVSTKKPWDFDSFHHLIATMAEEEQTPSEELNKTVPAGCLIEIHLSPSTKENQPPDESTKSPSKAAKMPAKSVRTPFKEIDPNTAQASCTRKSKRKYGETENASDTAPKRPCLSNSGLKSPPPAIPLKKSLLVDLCKNNFLMQVAGASGKPNLPRKADSVISISINSPQCRQLMKSGSKFFSSSHRRSLRTQLADVNASKHNASEVSDDVICFSDEEKSDPESEDLKIADDAMGLSWIPVSNKLGSTPKKEGMKKTCRSLLFKSESSAEDHISESEPESRIPQLAQGQHHTIKTADHVLLPDLTIHCAGQPSTKPCFVRLSTLYADARQYRGHMKVNGVKITHKDDIVTIQNETLDFRFRNYS